jgi:hypothetical protein
MFELCEAKSGYIYNLEVYAGPQPTNTEYNMAFSVVDRLCYEIKGKGHCVFTDRWFSSPNIFNHLWACKTKAVGRVISNRKKCLNKHFQEK